MKTIKFSGEINHESVKGLIDAIEESKSDDVVIYFSSIGGDVPDAKVLTHYINTSPDRYTLIGYYHLTSAGFTVFMEAKCKKYILDHTIAGIHLLSIDIDSRSAKDEESYTSFAERELERENADFISLLTQLGIFSDGIEKLKSGKDIFLTDNSIRAMLYLQKYESDKL